MIDGFKKLDLDNNECSMHLTMQSSEENAEDCNFVKLPLNGNDCGNLTMQSSAENAEDCDFVKSLLNGNDYGNLIMQSSAENADLHFVKLPLN